MAEVVPLDSTLAGQRLTIGYLDATAGLWYSNVGHGRPEIRAAVAAQMERMEACSAFFDLANPPVLELADALAKRAPMPSKVFFNSGGSDSIDTAAKLARRYWWELGQPDRTVLVSRTAAYHGTHGFGTALGGIPSNRQGMGPLGETVQVRHNSLQEMEDTFERIGPERMLQRVVRLVGSAVGPVVVVAAPGQEIPPLPDRVAVVRDPQVQSSVTSPEAAMVTEGTLESIGEYERAQQLFSTFGGEQWIRGDMEDAAKHAKVAMQLGGCSP